MTTLNEGFWDAVVTKAKRIGLAGGALAGSRSAQGKLNAENLALDFYNAFKVYQGETGDNDMVSFLENNVEFGPEFAQTWGENFEVFLDDPKGFFDGSNEEPPEPTHQAQQEAPEPQSDNDTAPEQVEDDREELKAMGLTKGADGKWEGDIKGGRVSIEKKGDSYSITTVGINGTRTVGSVPIDQVVRKTKQMVAAEFAQQTPKPAAPKMPPQELEQKAQGLGLTSDSKDSWVGDFGGKTFKIVRNKIGQYDAGQYENGAMVAGATNVSGDEALKTISDLTKDQQPTKTKTTRKKRTVNSESFENTESVLVESADGDLRKFFLKLAQDALKTGAAKSAARDQMRRVIRKRTPNPTPTQQAHDVIDKAKASTSDIPTAPTAEPVPGLKLSDEEKEDLVTLQDTTGWENILKVPASKEAEALAKKIIVQAANSLSAAQKKKK